MTAPTAPLSRFLRACRRLWRKITGADAKPSIRQTFCTFFGDDLELLETHDKSFPGYDVASLSRALASFRQECCLESGEIGSCPARNMRMLLDSFKTPYGRVCKPDPPAFQRVATDVDEETSIVASGLYLGVMRPEAGAGRVRPSASVNPERDGRDGDRPPEKIAVLLTVGPGHEYWDGMETNHVPAANVNVSIACRCREVADRLFAEVEERRQRLSIYRGKVIDPILHGGIIHAIGFRAVKQVREGDLVLPEAVKELLQQSVVGFYRHGALLQDLGVELKRGIVLHGPPGTGKTSIGLYLAGLLPGFTVCFVSGERLLYPREVCRMARYLQPAMVVFEDIDLVAQDRDANGLATVLGELMNQIDGCEPTDRVLFLMNTNSLDRLEAAVRNRPGRVDQIIEVPLPDREARQLLLNSFARQVKLAVGDQEAVLDATRDMSPAMLKEVVKRAVVAAVGRNHENRGADGVVLQEADLLLAARQVQAMRDPVVAPGGLGFRREPEERRNHADGRTRR